MFGDAWIVLGDDNVILYFKVTFVILGTFVVIRDGRVKKGVLL